MNNQQKKMQNTDSWFKTKPDKYVVVRVVTYIIK